MCDVAGKKNVYKKLWFVRSREKVLMEKIGEKMENFIRELEPVKNQVESKDQTKL